MRVLVLLLVIVALAAGCKKTSHCECYSDGSYKDGPRACVKTCAELFV